MWTYIFRMNFRLDRQFNNFRYFCIQAPEAASRLLIQDYFGEFNIDDTTCDTCGKDFYIEECTDAEMEKSLTDPYKKASEIFVLSFKDMTPAQQGLVTYFLNKKAK